MRKTTHRAIAVATAGTMALTGLMVQPVAAAPAQTKAPVAKQEQAEGMTDVSSGRRHYRRGDRAAIGAMLGIVGTIGAIAAANNYRRHHRYYYDDAPYAYGGGPYHGYYNYGGPRFHGHHGHHHHHWR
jgi:hypothetical protein